MRPLAAFSLMALPTWATGAAQTPENFAATIYDALAIPRKAEWHDTTGRPYAVYLADPIRGLWG